MARHGRAVMPWGKYRGVRIRLLPDSYVSWLTTSVIMQDAKWWWLRESLEAELRFRGLRADLAATPDPAVLQEEPEPEISTRPLRRYRLD